ncbi:MULTISPECIES: exopolysaccharide biosynthesis protein [unclassified Roseibium]|uniref:exopolysaccharide biosynthesis protein n=1 Tax=unclassified Roseibium TaxID=2629323 RepID=UPI00273EB6BE|nr:MULTISPECIES: exopolysaccharide biosynthesis protein [unclassified Roseibium]
MIKNMPLRLTSPVCQQDALGDEASLGQLIDAADGLLKHGQVSVEQIIEAFGVRSFAPVLLIPALALVTPLSGIPLFSSACGVLISLVAGQWLIGRRRIWLPRQIARRGISSDRFSAAIDRLRPLAGWLDARSDNRLGFVFKPPLKFLLPLTCLMIGLVIPVLELVPFSSSLLGGTVVLIAFSRLVRDGVFALLAVLPLGLAGLAASAFLSG